jgi:hypothetical protein
MARTAQSRKLTSARGEATVELFPPDVVLLTLRGHWENAILSQLVRELGRVMPPREQVDFFIDAELLAGYDTEVRVGMTEWVIKNRPSIRSFHGLVRSKIVAMGASVANLALGGFLKIHTDPHEFQIAFEAASGIRVTRASSR